MKWLQFVTELIMKINKFAGWAPAEKDEKSEKKEQKIRKKKTTTTTKHFEYEQVEQNKSYLDELHCLLKNHFMDRNYAYNIFVPVYSKQTYGAKEQTNFGVTCQFTFGIMYHGISCVVYCTSVGRHKVRGFNCSFSSFM